MRPKDPAPPLLARQGACWLWHDRKSEEQWLWSCLLHPEQQPGASRIGAGARDKVGRGAAWCVPAAPGRDDSDTSYVCRQYRRGGLMGRLNESGYLWTGAANTRPYREFMVMHRAAELGLRVPKPVAAMACRGAGLGGLFYRAAILTPWVSHVGSLASVSNEAAWCNAGRAIAKLHAAGIWHADLNVHNILIDACDKVWLIDFDRAREDIDDPRVLQGNLSRLKRSVDKVCPEMGQRLWSVLCDGYAGR